jgi:phosphatidylglycerophosphate synthase
MNSAQLAVILLSPLKSGYSLILENKIAGMPLLKRLILTLQRAGIQEFLVLSRHLDEQEIKAQQKNIEKDFRFKSSLRWHDRAKFFDANGGEQAKSLNPSQPFLLVNGNLVTHQKVVQRFMELGNNPSDKNFCLALDPGKPGGLYLFPPEKFSTLSQHTATEEDRAERITLPGDKNFWIEVTDNTSAMTAEKTLLGFCKNHYTQFMDIWFNSLFSIPISAVLVKTPLTPNMLTLFGLFIGFLAGWCFAQGIYLASVAGGLLLALTAIWDCCDGDVARLKLMESDFGETLDTACDNIINVFIFTGIMLGVAKTHGWGQALIPFIMLAIGGGLIFIFIYFPQGGKGSFFKESSMYDVIQILASRNFIYVILIFAIGGHLDWFLWLAGIGSLIFALALFIVKRQALNKTL